MKSIILSALFVLLVLACYSQPADIQAKSAFLAAQDAYGNGDYHTAIEKLEHVKKLLGSTNPRVEHLLANAYFENGEFDKSQASLNTYFELAADSDVNYLQMVRMVEEIPQRKAEREKEVDLAARDYAAWSVARQTHTSESYEGYLKEFPEGKYNKEAKSRTKLLPPTPLMDERDGETYKTVRIGDQVWMAENLKYHHPQSICAEQDGLNCDTLGRLYPLTSISEICPQGWRVPLRDDYESLINTLFGHQTPMDGSDIYGIRSYNIGIKELKRLRSTSWNGTNEFAFDLRKVNASVQGSSRTFPGSYLWTKTGTVTFVNVIIFDEQQNPSLLMACRCIKE